ncbi:ANTAR domain-containing protein [Streptomyces sp. NPDC048643]|uniref:ANTAR domain-containing protein n=1 Tax=Streptomyces sp. NPDC048643 TaxID=3155637 RepID=UPI003438CD12
MSELLAFGHDDPAAAAPAAAGADDKQTAPSVRPQGDGVRQAAVDRATGVVMALGRLDGRQAGAVLSEVSRRTGITLSRVAGLLTVWAPTGELNLGLRIALEEAIREQHRVAPTEQAQGGRGAL